MFIPAHIEKRIHKLYKIQKWVKNVILRKKSKEILDINRETVTFTNILRYAQYIYDWVWLAAPQIGKNIRMICVSQYNKTEDKLLFVELLINPIITEHSDETNAILESCLSLPNREWKVNRYNWIKVDYLDIHWNKKTIEAEMLNATILQHEIDHLDGVLFVDKLVKKR